MPDSDTKGTMDYTKEIVRIINEISGSRSPYEVFCDWVKCMALAISNFTDIRKDSVWQKREEEYLRTIKPYGENVKRIIEMRDLLILALEENMSDVLGKVYMDSGCGNKNTGQFFTPFHVSIAVAEVSLPKNIDPGKKITLNEPSCGGGGMIIAAAAVLKKRGLNYQRILQVVAQDLDWKGVYMTYVQLSLLGIDAIVAQGNTLSEPFDNIRTYPQERIFRTPMQKGLLI